MVLPPGEFNVMIPEPHATLQGVKIPSAILKIVFRHIFVLFLMQFKALTSDSLRIVSDTLVNVNSTFSITAHDQLAMYLSPFHCVEVGIRSSKGANLFAAQFFIP